MIERALIGRTLAALWTAAALAGAVACTEISSDPKAVVAIELDPPALPSVIVGDSLRDSLGIAAPLVVRIFNAKDQVIPGGRATFVAIDTGHFITLDPLTGTIKGNKPSGTVPSFVVASAGGLQSARDTVYVTLRPTQLVPVDPVAARDSVQLYIGGDTLKTLKVSLRADTGRVAGTTSLVPVPRYVVQFSIIYPAALTNTDTTQVYLADDNRRPSLIDTTDASGLASRGIRLGPHTRNLSQADSVVVRVTAYRPDPSPARRVPVPGSPILFSIKVKQPITRP